MHDTKITLWLIILLSGLQVTIINHYEDIWFQWFKHCSQDNNLQTSQHKILEHKKPNSLMDHLHEIIISANRIVQISHNDVSVWMEVNLLQNTWLTAPRLLAVGEWNIPWVVENALFI